MSENPVGNGNSSASGVSASGSTYIMYAVFRWGSGSASIPVTERVRAAAEVDGLLAELATKGVTTRGVYDVSGFRHDADVMFWWIAASSDDLQEAYVRFRRTALGQASEPVWSAIGVHRESEFNKAHIPSFLEGKAPGAYIAVYPYNRTNEWYLLDPADRARMLSEHGAMGREYTDVLPNTVSAFALGDYEFLLSFEAAELHRIVDLMRHLRGAQARAYTRLETPFFTGPRRAVADIGASVP